MNKKKNGTYFLLVLGSMFLGSFLLLSFLSFLVWKMDGGLGIISGGVIAVYVLVNIVGGFLLGKRMGKQKFFWGMLVGVAYFLVLLLVGICLVETKIMGNLQLINGGMICLVSGTFGGMLAPGVKVK